MEDEGHISFHNVVNDLGQLERIDCIWEGGKTTYLGIHALMMPITKRIGKDRIQIGNYKLRRIDNGYDWLSAKYIREDYPFWFLFLIWSKIYKILDIIYRRMILTLVIWGLAKYESGTLPSWRDIGKRKNEDKINLIKI